MSLAAPASFSAGTPADRALFAANFPHTPFEFNHSLHHHPAFQLEALLSTAQRNEALGHKAHFESGTPDPNAWFGQRPEGETLVSALASIHSGKSWVILKRIHEDPVYRSVLAELIPQISAVAGIDLLRDYYDPTMTIFITSPGRITPYHIDGETNFLFQIRGEKLAYIYNGLDKAVLSDADMEQYWTGALPKINLPADVPHGHWQYQLQPGNGVFNPAVFPHWLQNGDDVSISVSINFKLTRDATVAAHRTNRFLRKAGLTPTPPGQSPTLDRLKENTFGRTYNTLKTLRAKLRK